MLTIGSDAHIPAHLAAGWETAVEMARTAGFTHLTTFAERSPFAILLDAENGNPLELSITINPINAPS